MSQSLRVVNLRESHCFNDCYQEKNDNNRVCKRERKKKYREKEKDRETERRERIIFITNLESHCLCLFRLSLSLLPTRLDSFKDCIIYFCCF